MAPKTHFSIPLKNTVTPAQWGEQVTHTTESILLQNASRCATSGTVIKATNAQEFNTIKTYPLLFAEPQYASEDDGDDDNVEPPCEKVSNASLIGSSNSMNYVYYIYIS